MCFLCLAGILELLSPQTVFQMGVQCACPRPQAQGTSSPREGVGAEAEAAAAEDAPKLAKLKAPAPLEAAEEEAAGVDAPNKLPAAAEGAPKRPLEGVDEPNPPKEKLGWELGAAAGWLPAPDAGAAPKRPPACVQRHLGSSREIGLLSI